MEAWLGEAQDVKDTERMSTRKDPQQVFSIADSVIGLCRIQCDRDCTNAY